MARRSNTAVVENDTENVENTEVTEAEATEAPEVESPEAVEAAVEAVEEEVRDTSGDTVITGGEAEIDLAPFEQAASAAVAQRDTSTGDLPEGALEPVLEQYRALPSTKDRNRAKAHLKDAMKDAMEKMDLSLARAFLTMQESMTTAPAKGAASERKPADPLAAWKSNLLTSLIAYGELAGAAVPEGGNVDEVQATASATEVVEEVNAYRTWLDAEVAEGEDRPEAPKVRPEVVQAFRLARGSKTRARAGGASTGGGTPHEGPRRDLGRHIEEAFANLNDGDFLSVAEIRKFQSSVYEDEQPSAGAISARLFPAKGECTVPGVRPGTGGEKGTKGAYKVA